ncbi:hypothetical protein D3C81_1338500 [compost metagenome]
MQALRGTLGDAPDAVQVGGDHVAPVVLADVQAALAVGDAGVVQHHVDHAEGCFGGVEGGFDGGAVGDVQRHADRFAAGGADFLLDLGEAVDAAGGQYHAATGAGGGARQMGADAAGGTGDQDGLAGQGEVRLFTHEKSWVGMWAKKRPLHCGRIKGTSVDQAAEIAPSTTMAWPMVKLAWSLHR